MRGLGWHWTASSIAGLILTGRFVPLCALAYAAPECMARRGFLRLMDRVFEPDHCRRVWLTYRIGRAIRWTTTTIKLQPAPLDNRAGVFAIPRDAVSPARASPGMIELETEMQTDAEYEKMIQEAGKTAPRLTPDKIDAVIVSEMYHVFPGTTLTVCALTLRNGYIVTGESAAAHPENFDAAIGRKIARDNARNKIWGLEGYLLRERLFHG